MYKCANCSKIFNRGEIQLDHVAPVIDPTTGFIDWNTYISRLFADESGWQVLCRGCHQAKSNAENRVRRGA
jgi:5-methylcytosine-specific restriction endonuclease McrA